MTICTSLKALRERVVADFCSAAEFKAYTQLAFAFAGDHIHCPTAPETLIVGYTEFAQYLGLPDKTLRSSDLAPIFVATSGAPLLALVHQHQVVIFEAAYFDAIKLLLLDNPLRLPGKRQIEYSAVVAAASREEVLAYMVERELNELKYKPVAEWFAYLNRLVTGVNVTDLDVCRIAEAKATRDLLVHNSGIVNDIYIQKAGSLARYKVGETVTISSDYALEAWQLLSRATIAVIDTMAQKLCADA